MRSDTAAPQAGGGWQEQMLYFFQGGNDGADPDSLLIVDPAGNLYGMTGGGGKEGCGTVYKLSPSTGGVWSERILHQFTGGPDGCAPFLNMVRNVAGALYGVAEAGGATDNGAIFQISPAGVEQVLFSFPGGNGGSDPRSLILNSTRGALFGITFGLGSTSSGIIFEIAN